MQSRWPQYVQARKLTMNMSRAGHAPDLWIVQNPWLRDAFRQVPPDHAAGNTVGVQTAAPTAPGATLDRTRGDAVGAGDTAGSHS
jgi:hypothetical protein